MCGVVDEIIRQVTQTYFTPNPLKLGASASKIAQLMIYKPEGNGNVEDFMLAH